LANNYKITCPRCGDTHTFTTHVLVYHDLSIGCTNCGHFWTEKNIEGLPDNQTDKALYERGKKCFDDIVIPD